MALTPRTALRGGVTRATRLHTERPRRLSQNFAPRAFSGVTARDPEGQETRANEQDQRREGYHGAATARLWKRGGRGLWGGGAARGRARGGPEPGGLARPGLRAACLEVRIL